MTGLPRSSRLTRQVRSALFTGSGDCFSLAHDKGQMNPCAHSIAFWPKPVVCAFSLLGVTVFIEHLHVLTLLPTLGLSL